MHSTDGHRCRHRDGVGAGSGDSKADKRAHIHSVATGRRDRHRDDGDGLFLEALEGWLGEGLCRGWCDAGGVVTGIVGGEWDGRSVVVEGCWIGGWGGGGGGRKSG